MNQKRKAKAYIFGPILWGWNTSNSLDVTIAIYDEEYIQQVIAGPKGMSPELRVRKLSCSICGQNYEECSHLEGKTYDEKKCECLMDEIEPINVVNVTTPEDSRSKITDMLVLPNNKSCTWYGFETSKNNQRFNHIHLAQKNGHISEKAALRFATFFCNTDVGVVKFPH